MAGQKKRIDVGMDLGSKSSEISCTGNGGIFNDAYICIAMFVPRISSHFVNEVAYVDYSCTGHDWSMMFCIRIYRNGVKGISGVLLGAESFLSQLNSLWFLVILSLCWLIDLFLG